MLKKRCSKTCNPRALFPPVWRLGYYVVSEDGTVYMYIRTSRQIEDTPRNWREEKGCLFLELRVSIRVWGGMACAVDNVVHDNCSGGAVSIKQSLVNKCMTNAFCGLGIEGTRFPVSAVDQLDIIV